MKPNKLHYLAAAATLSGCVTMSAPKLDVPDKPVVTILNNTQAEVVKTAEPRINENGPDKGPLHRILKEAPLKVTFEDFMKKFNELGEQRQKLRAAKGKKLKYYEECSSTPEVKECTDLVLPALNENKEERMKELKKCIKMPSSSNPSPTKQQEKEKLMTCVGKTVFSSKPYINRVGYQCIQKQIDCIDHSLRAN